MTFDPSDWLITTTRSLKDYLDERFASAVMSGNTGSGLDIYEIIMLTEDSSAPAKPMDMTKTIIALEIDDIDTRPVGVGTNIFNSDIVDGTVLAPGTVTDQQAQRRVINFDVGIWATDDTGGSTNRMRAYYLLDKFLSGEIARQKCMAYTEGVEILYYRSGRFITETIDDVRVFRVVGAELEVRVFSRDDADPDILVDQEPTQQPELEIQGDSGSLVDLPNS